jgi:ABC-type branched-subunit amino acid transport system ATPase component
MNTDPTPMPMLELQAVHKHFGGVRANDGVSLAVPAGAIVGLIGPNGSGKTTLFNAVTGSPAPDSGRVRFDGRDITGLGPAAVARLGLLRTFQQAGVFGGLSCLDNLLASQGRAAEPVLAMWRRPRAHDRDRAQALLDLVGLSAKASQLAGELSYGQRKLLELAMALMNRPRMLLLDEPTAGVSPALIPELVERLRHANTAMGITLLVIEHNMQVIMDLAHHVLCMARGRVLASGTPEQVRADERVLQAYLGGAGA